MHMQHACCMFFFSHFFSWLSWVCDTFFCKIKARLATIKGLHSQALPFGLRWPLSSSTRNHDLYDCTRRPSNLLQSFAISFLERIGTWQMSFLHCCGVMSRHSLLIARHSQSMVLQYLRAHPYGTAYACIFNML